MIGMYAERKPKGFGFSDTAFRIFILMASRRLESDRFFTATTGPRSTRRRASTGSRTTRCARSCCATSRSSSRRCAACAEPVRAVAAGRDRVIELAPGIYSLGHGKGGHVHAFLARDGRRALCSSTRSSRTTRASCCEAIRAARPRAHRPEADRDHARATARTSAGWPRSSARAARPCYAHRWEADIVAGDRRAQAVSILPQQSLKLIPFQLGLWLDRARSTIRARSTSCSTRATRSGRSQVLHASGHSPGHLDFWWPERELLDRRRRRRDLAESLPGLARLQPEQRSSTTLRSQRLAALGPRSSASATATRSPRVPERSSTSSRASRSLDQPDDSTYSERAAAAR